MRIDITVVGASLVFPLLFLSPVAADPNYSSWSSSENLGATINSRFQEFGPAISKHGLSLYFTSDRPGGFGGADLWVSQRASEDDAWSPPLNLGATINTAASENVPALSRDSHFLFFNSTRPGGFGGQDIWVSYREHIHDDFAWGPPFNLGTGVNTAFGDVSASYFENDEGGAPLLYFSSNRPGGFGAFDIYVSQLGADGIFGAATHVPELSSPADENMPSIRIDGLEMILRRGPTPFNGDIWVSTRDNVIDPWSAPIALGPPVNTPFGEQHVHLAPDRQTLLFSSDRPGGFGALDLYVATRTRKNQQ